MNIKDLKSAKARFDFKKAGGAVVKCAPGRAAESTSATFTSGQHRRRGRSPSRKDSVWDLPEKSFNPELDKKAKS